MLKQTAICLALGASLFTNPAVAGGVEYTIEDEYGSREQAKAMLARAVAAMTTDRTGAITRFNNNDRQFRDRDLFVFCFNRQDGKFTAHEAMVGQDVRTLRDTTDKPFGAQIYTNAREHRIDSVVYMSTLPGSTEQIAKRANFIQIGDQVCGVTNYQFNTSDMSPTD